MPEDIKDQSKDTGDKAAAVSKEEFETLKNQHSELMKKFEALSTKDKAKDEDPDLKARAAKEREESDKKKTDIKALENALSFNMQSKKFWDDNQALLPKQVEDIFKTADKETYDSALDKASAIKAGIVQEFFAVQDNLDLLTPGQKTALEDFLKLTKNGKQEKASGVYDQIFEPTFEMLKRLKKAQHLSKGLGDGSDDAYKMKLMNGSKQHYLGEKSNA